MKIGFIGIFLIIQGFLFLAISQDKHDYVTPLDKQLFVREVHDANRTVLGMNEIGAITTGKDGLMVDFGFRVNTSTAISPIKLLSFTLETEDRSFMDIFYDQSTLTFRRKYSSGSSFYYEYNLYDPLFVIREMDVTWNIRVWFTSSFFWVETRLTSTPVNNKWHAPLFFGLNLPIRACMNDYLSRLATAKIVFGDGKTPTVFTMPGEIAIHEFKYSELRIELNEHFSKDR